MKLLPDKLGGNPKQMAILGVLVVALVIAYVLNRTPSAAPVATPARVAPAPQSPEIEKTPVVTARRASSRIGNRGEDWHPSLKLPEGLDVNKIDPTIHSDLLEKLRGVPAENGTRGSVFAFGQAPPPPQPKVDPIKVKAMETAAAAAKKQAEEAAKNVPPPKPTAPPIPLKFYGYSAARGTKRAFFLDGDDIDVVSENEVIKNRYKVIRIGINSVVVEDMSFKSQQTLPLVEELAG